MTTERPSDLQLSDALARIKQHLGDHGELRLARGESHAGTLLGCDPSTADLILETLVADRLLARTVEAKSSMSHDEVYRLG